MFSQYSLLVSRSSQGGAKQFSGADFLSLFCEVKGIPSLLDVCFWVTNDSLQEKKQKKNKQKKRSGKRYYL